MNEFCFVNSPFGALQMDSEIDFISRMKFREGDSLQLYEESKKVGGSPT